MRSVEEQMAELRASEPGSYEGIVRRMAKSMGLLRIPRRVAPYPGFCKGEREAQRRIRQVLRGQLLMDGTARIEASHFEALLSRQLKVA
jgi:hypothetical protein